MIVTIHQPEHLPWLGFIQKVSMADVFVILDTVQFRKNYFQNRNRILTANGPAWLTVPVTKHPLDTPIKDIRINNNTQWQKKYLKSIYYNYIKSAYFEKYMAALENLISLEYHYLSDLNTAIIEWLLTEFKVQTKIVKASEIIATEAKNDMLLLEICSILGAQTYISGISGREYLNTSVFDKKGVNIHYQKFFHPVYPQLQKEFHPCMSSIDLLFNHGDDSSEVLLNKDMPRLDYLFE